MSRGKWSSITGLATLFIFLTGCQSMLPVRSVPVEDQAPLYKAPTFSPTLAPLTTPTVQTASTQESACSNMLQYIEPDLTYPDGTEVKPGEVIDKQWKVKNSGTCNWDASYSIRFVGGQDMNAQTEQALVPARNGTETVISIKFTAPEEPDRYYSQWKAFDAEGNAFGDMLYLDITVVKE